MTLLAHSLPAAQDFYGALFGWEFESGGDVRVGPYTRAIRAESAGHEVAGIGELSPETRQPPVWTPYFTVHDADEAAAGVRSTAGTVAVGPLDLGERGRMAMCADPAGAVFGLWQPATHRGPVRTPLPGTAVWNELWAPEPSMMSRFYEWLFGYAVDKQADGSVMLLAAGEVVAAIRPIAPTLPPHTPPFWGTHFAVTDVDGSAAKALALGGRVLREPYDGAGGRRAEVADPEGAEFTLVASR
ncbi:VOC family protein [Streptomyces smaragdinus]|uniref:VOC family protein n=1 Tax=Streptomyces smaragdinus TaxID=2585196 RepID=UPI002B202F48|nr:VOC family protein [Streptomyces smaragdinus]